MRYFTKETHTLPLLTENMCVGEWQLDSLFSLLHGAKELEVQKEYRNQSHQFAGKKINKYTFIAQQILFEEFRFEKNERI